FVGLDGNGAASTTAVSFDGNGATVRDSFLSAGTAIITSSSGTIERSELRGRWAGVVAYHGPIGIASSRIVMTGSDSTGIFAAAFTANVSINVDGGTLYSTAPLGSNAGGICANHQRGGAHT